MTVQQERSPDEFDSTDDGSPGHRFREIDGRNADRPAAKEPAAPGGVDWRPEMPLSVRP